MRMAVEKPDKRLHGFEGVFNANAFSVPAVHIESKMIMFYEWTAALCATEREEDRWGELLQGFRLFFSGKFCIRLCFCLENGCAALKVQSPGAIWYIKGFPYPVGKFTNTSLPLRNSTTAFSCCGLRLRTPNVEHTAETALTLVTLARDFLLPPSVNARSLAIKLFKLFASGE